MISSQKEAYRNTDKVNVVPLQDKDDQKLCALLIMVRDHCTVNFLGGIPCIHQRMNMKHVLHHKYHSHCLVQCSKVIV